jgi:hypothetical protein
MAVEITQGQLRNDSGAIRRGPVEGETDVVTSNGVPIGEVAPMRHHRFVRAEAALAAFANVPGIDLERRTWTGSGPGEGVQVPSTQRRSRAARFEHPPPPHTDLR